MQAIPQKQIRAHYDVHTIRVYQAYPDVIADSALAHGTFVSPPFKLERMTWIKPSFLWMMYRSGWGLKDAGQNRILAIDISHEGFAWALANSCPSHPEPGQGKEEWERIKNASPCASSGTRNATCTSSPCPTAPSRSAWARRLHGVTSGNGSGASPRSPAWPMTSTPWCRPGAARSAAQAACGARVHPLKHLRLQPGRQPAAKA